MDNNYKLNPCFLINGYTNLNWKNKTTFTSTQYYSTQLKERYGEEDEDGWINKIFWGDNIQVMSHLLKDYRGKIDLIYIDPPFDSKSDYKRKIKLKGKEFNNNDIGSFEEKQYTDIWSNDEYLQFIYERLVLMRELLSEKGSIYLHCDWHKCHHIRCMMEEIFGIENFRSQIVWKKATKTTNFKNYGSEHDVILYFSKSPDKFIFNQVYTDIKESELITKYIYLEKNDGSIIKLSKEQKLGKEKIPEGRRFRGIPLTNMNQNRPNLEYEFLGYTRVWAVKEETMKKLQEDGLIFQVDGGVPQKKGYLDENKGAKVNDLWIDINAVNSQAKEKQGYPTQKPEKLLERIITVSSNEGDIVFDCFMGSGTTQSVAMKLNRKFIGSDINLGSIETTVKRLINNSECKGIDIYHMDNSKYLKESAISKIDINEHVIKINDFYPTYLLQNFKLRKEDIKDWRELVDSIMIDFDYNRMVFKPTIIDMPSKNELVKGEYEIPKDASVIKVKITDVSYKIYEFKLEIK